ncbi:MAG: septum formation initiator family protein [Clostridiales bacterium]|nr:septum formation initiator family protein [Clostridiales bacterium]
MFKRKVRRSREWSKNNQIIDFEKAREARKKNREGLVQNSQVEKRAKSEKPSKRKTSKRNRKRSFYALLVLVVIVLAGFSVYNVISVNSQRTQALAEQKSLESDKEKLTKELENVDSPEYIEEQARMLKMIKRGEVYYVIPEEQE